VAVNDGGTNLSGDQTFTTTSEANVVTLPAAPVSVVTATLNGVVIPNGQDTLAYFEYGTSTSYGTRNNTFADWQWIECGFSDQPASILCLKARPSIIDSWRPTVWELCWFKSGVSDPASFSINHHWDLYGWGSGSWDLPVVPGQQPLEIRADLGDAIPGWRMAPGPPSRRIS